MNILIIDDMHPSILALLEKRNIAYLYKPEATRREILALIPNFKGLIVRSKTGIDEAFLQQAPLLQWIGRAGSGMDLFDLAAIARRQIHIDNAPEGNRDSVAEHTIGSLLALLNKIPQANAQVKQKIWDREANRGNEIKGKNIAIIGYGNVGQEVARRLQNFDCLLWVYDKKPEKVKEKYVINASMNDIFAHADIVTWHIPLTPETQAMVNAHYLAQFKKPIITINTARGEILVLKDLCQALQTGSVKGACLDVLENEKLQTLSPEQAVTFDYLAQCPNVILSPHIAGWTFESYERINQVLIQKLDIFLQKIAVTK